MDTVALRLFVLAAEKLNISAAGRDLGMAPAVATAKLVLGSGLLLSWIYWLPSNMVCWDGRGDSMPRLPLLVMMLGLPSVGKVLLEDGRCVTDALSLATRLKSSGTLRVDAIPTFLE